VIIAASSLVNKVMIIVYQPGRIWQPSGLTVMRLFSF
jgi:hypothetical protein